MSLLMPILTTPLWRPRDEPAARSGARARGRRGQPPWPPHGRTREAGPFAGIYRLIDFPLSNCLHSGIGDVWVIQQYEPHELTKQLANGRPWDLDARAAGRVILHPHLGDSESGWYEGMRTRSTATAR